MSTISCKISAIFCE